MSSAPPTGREFIAALSAQSVETLSTVIEQTRVKIPAYAQLDLAQLLPDVQRSFGPLFAAIIEERELNATELAVLTAHGEARGRQGIPVIDMFQGWRLAVRLLTDMTIEEGRRAGVSDRDLLELSNDLLGLTDAAILAMASGHRAAEFALTRHDQQHRADLVRGILFGVLSPAEIRIEVARFGLDTGQEYRAIRARPNSAEPAERLILRLEPAPGASRPRSLVAVIDGDIAGFIDAAPPEDIGCAIGIGPPAQLDRIEPSFRQATRAMITADAFGRTGIHDLSKLGLLPAILADAEVGEEMLRRYVTPLGDSDGAAALLATVRHYLGNGMRVDHTAKEMQLHTNTIRYRLRRYEQLLGVDLANPDQALEAWWAVRRLELRKPSLA